MVSNITALIIAIGFGILVCILVGIPYIRGIDEIAKRQQAQTTFNKQEYVRNHLDVFGVKDAPGKEIKEVYYVSSEKIGF